MRFVAEFTELSDKSMKVLQNSQNLLGTGMIYRTHKTPPGGSTKAYPIPGYE